MERAAKLRRIRRNPLSNYSLARRSEQARQSIGNGDNANILTHKGAVVLFASLYGTLLGVGTAFEGGFQKPANESEVAGGLLLAGMILTAGLVAAHLPRMRRRLLVNTEV